MEKKLTKLKELKMEGMLKTHQAEVLAGMMIDSIEDEKAHVSAEILNGIILKIAKIFENIEYQLIKN